MVSLTPSVELESACSSSCGWSLHEPVTYTQTYTKVNAMTATIYCTGRHIVSSIHTHVQTYTHTYVQTHVHPYIHTHTFMRTHTCAYTRTCRHPLPLSSPLSPSCACDSRLLSLIPTPWVPTTAHPTGSTPHFGDHPRSSRVPPLVWVITPLPTCFRKPPPQH